MSRLDSRTLREVNGSGLLDFSNDLKNLLLLLLLLLLLFLLVARLIVQS